jgi:hypothetical protein
MSNIPVNVALSVLLESGYTSSRYIPPPPPKPVSDYLNIFNRDCEIQEMKEEEKVKIEKKLKKSLLKYVLAYGSLIALLHMPGIP